MKTTKFTLFLMLLVSCTYAQEYAFKVLANKGSNEVKSGTVWLPLKTGSSLNSGDELKLGENAYLGLVHKSGKPLEVKKSGSYKVALLESEIKTSSGVLMKYTDFILSSNSAEAKKTRLSATGAVDRGENYAIRLLLPENQYSGIYSNIAVVTWEGSGVAGPYVVTLKNMFEDELAKLETPETTLQIDLADPRYAKENTILVDVKSKTDPKKTSKAHMIKRLPAVEQADIKKSLTEITTDVTEETALNKFILAGFYEEHNLLIDAIGAYEDAIRMQPDVATYREGYDDFLLRHGIK